MTDPESHTTLFDYDSLNRLLQTTNPLSGTTSVTYDALGNRLTSTDANNHTTIFTYDDLNRLVQTTDANDLTTVTSYDGLGNRLSTTNAAGETTTFVYDNANRLSQIVNPQSEIVNYQYDGAGNRTAMIDAEGVETRYGYDPLNRLTSVVENYVDGTFDPTITDEDVTTEYRYDKVGNRTKVIDARSNETIYVYDDLNRRSEMRDPLGNATFYGYDAIGNRTVITDANGDITLFDYDPVNRLETIDYSDTTPDVSFTYDEVGNRLSMVDGTGVTTYTYDSLYRLTMVKDGAGFLVGYDYDDVGNRTRLVYPDGKDIVYTYDDGNRLETVTDWHNGQFGYNYDEANRLTDLILPNGVESTYTYDNAGRLIELSHQVGGEALSSYAYDLDNVGNRTTLTETLLAMQPIPSGTYLESTGWVVVEAENGQAISGTTHAWLTATKQSGYTGTAYLQVLPDTDKLYQTGEITSSPTVQYPIYFITPATYTVWLRGYASSAAGDSAYMQLEGNLVNVTGLAPGAWEWTSQTMNGETAKLVVEATGLYTVSLRMREDGLRIDRLLLTTDTTFIPSGFGPAETERQVEGGVGQITLLNRTIVYTYDNLYRLINADYTSGESYEYEYDPVGNRLQQIINGDTTAYLYDAANRLAQVDGQSYTFDANGNLLASGAMTNTWDVANRLVETSRDVYTLQPIYNGLGDRVEQTMGVTTTYFALDVQGLPAVIYTSPSTSSGQAGNVYLHLPGVTVAESTGGKVHYLLRDGLGSVRQAVDELGQVVVYNEYDPYGNPVSQSSTLPASQPYGYTGEWWEDDVGLLHLRARWYLPETGTFLSVDPVESEPPYQYVRGNPSNWVDPFGYMVERSGVGTAFMYSCNCGWIDWTHAGERGYALIKAIDDAQKPGKWGWASVSKPILSGEPKSLLGIDVGSFTKGEVLVFTNLSKLDRYRVALGIFMSKENLFEAHQGGEFLTSRALVTMRPNRSPFSEEDLISNLIGFHRGLMSYTSYKAGKAGQGYKDDDIDWRLKGRVKKYNYSDEDQFRGQFGSFSESYFRRVCDVVGLSLLETGREEEFIKKQQQIFDQYPPFKMVFEWGKPRLGAWQGSIEVDCQSVQCINPKVPSDLLWLDPAPPYPYQSTQPTWTWRSATANLYLSDPTQPNFTANIPADYLNQIPLWDATGYFNLPGVTLGVIADVTSTIIRRNLSYW